MKKHNFIENKVLLFAVFVFILSSCSPTKYLNDEQSLLTKNNIIVHSDTGESEKKQIIHELGYLTKQKPNSNWFLFFPREYFYLKHSQPQDSSWYNKWVRREIGEPPTIYEDQVSSITASTMEQYLQNKKGYYHARVNYEHVTRNQRTMVIIQCFPE